MRKIWLLIFLALLVVFANQKQKAEESVVEKITSNPSPTFKPNSYGLQRTTIELNYQDQPLTLLIVPIAKNASLTLLPNFTAKESAINIVKRNNCNLAINGGFYQKNDTPLGLFITGKDTLGESTESNLVNAFFWQNQNGRFIGRIPPENFNGDFIFQSGPLFNLPNQNPVNMLNDKPSRRSLVGKDHQNTIYFITMYNPQSLFAGPNLADIPSLLSKPEVQSNVRLTHILNLDGGSASFFYSKDGEITLSELVPIGSLLCVR